MALTNKSLFLYNFTVDDTNNKLDFVAALAGSTLTATITSGVYSLQDLMTAVTTAMNAADIANTYTSSIDRTISSGTQNRVTIITSGTYLSLLFGSGPNALISCASLLGYTSTDKTGATSYQSQSTAGTALQPTFIGYSYTPPTMMKKTIASVNVSASGIKETVYFAQHQFFQVTFKYEPQATVISAWQPLMDWMSSGSPFEFTPDVTAGNTVFNCTLERTQYDSLGNGYWMPEMLPDFPFLYQTGNMVFRIIPAPVTFL